MFLAESGSWWSTGYILISIKVYWTLSMPDTFVSPQRATVHMEWVQQLFFFFLIDVIKKKRFILSSSTDCQKNPEKKTTTTKKNTSLCIELDMKGKYISDWLSSHFSFHSVVYLSPTKRKWSPKLAASRGAIVWPTLLKGVRCLKWRTQQLKRSVRQLSRRTEA